MQQSGQSIIHDLLMELADACGFVLQPKGSSLEWSDVFWYTFGRVQNVTHGQTASPVQIQIQNDSDFEWQASIMWFDLAQAAFTYSTQPMPNASVTIVETGSGKQLMNTTTPLGSLFGIPETGPMYLCQPKVLKRNSVVQATVTNFDAAVDTGDIWMTFIGRKLYNANVANG